MTPWTRLTLPLAALLLQACTPTPEEVATTADVGSSTGSTSAGPGPSTTPGSTTPGEDTMGTQGGTGLETTMGAVDTTAGSSSSGETTMGVEPTSSTSGESSSSGEPPPPPECMNDDQCPNNEICDMGNCVDACGGAWAAGTYDACINEYGGTDVMGLCGNASDICIVDDVDLVGASTCSVQSCADACDCPAPPGTGDAVVTCANITNGGTPNDCYLDCANGENCPTGMSCFAGFVCMTPVPGDVPVYGNCGGLVPDCAAPGFCLDGAGDTSVCQIGCTMAGDCPAAPPTGNAPVTCGLANPGHGGSECYLDCSSGQTCPVGMFCYDGYICAFP